MHLPSGGKPPATDEEECLRGFCDSEFGKGSVSEVANLLPLALAWDKFYRRIFTTRLIRSQYTFASVLISINYALHKKWSTKGLISFNIQHCTMQMQISPVYYHQQKVANYLHHFKQTSDFLIFLSKINLSLQSYMCTCTCTTQLNQRRVYESPQKSGYSMQVIQSRLPIYHYLINLTTINSFLSKSPKMKSQVSNFITSFLQS